MRCNACDVALTDYESTLRCANTGEFIDMCVACLIASGFECYNDRADLRSLSDLPEIRSLFDDMEHYDEQYE